jgi:S-formylglutathione hydrolase
MQEGWTQLKLAGKRVDAFSPDSPRFAVLYLHPLGEEMLADNRAFTEALRQQQLACLAPWGAKSWWADRPCPEFDPILTPEAFLLKEVVPEFARRWPGLPTRYGAFGISMGGQGALRLGFRQPYLFPVVAGIASAIDYHELYGQGQSLDQMYRSREACRNDTATLQLNPGQVPPAIWFVCDPDDIWWRGNDRLQEKLTALGVAHNADLETRAGGHTWDYFDAQAQACVTFLASALARESRRLL